MPHAPPLSVVSMSGAPAAGLERSGCGGFFAHEMPAENPPVVPPAPDRPHVRPLGGPTLPTALDRGSFTRALRAIARRWALLAKVWQHRPACCCESVQLPSVRQRRGGEGFS